MSDQTARLAAGRCPRARVLDAPAAIGLWLALTLAGVIVAFVANGQIWAVVGWAVGGVAAFVLIAVKARRGE